MLRDKKFLSPNLSNLLLFFFSDMETHQRAATKRSTHRKLPHLFYLPSALVLILLLGLPLHLEAWPINFFRGSRIGNMKYVV